MLSTTPPDGPRWLKDAWIGMPQTDGRGVRWEVVQIEQGGRVLHWRSSNWSRKARTEVVASHPHYPNDSEVLAAERAVRKERARWR